MANVKLIQFDCSCPPDANTFALVEQSRNYMTNRFGGEKWDLSFSGENYCNDSICKALVSAFDYINSMKFDLPCCCDDNVLKLLQEAQIIAADAILKGWRPFEPQGQSGPLVRSISSPDEGSVTFASAVPLNTYMNGGQSDIGASTKRRIEAILSPIKSKSRGRQVIL